MCNRRKKDNQFRFSERLKQLFIWKEALHQQLGNPLAFVLWFHFWRSGLCFKAHGVAFRQHKCAPRAILCFLIHIPYSLPPTPPQTNKQITKIINFANVFFLQYLLWRENLLYSSASLWAERNGKMKKDNFLSSTFYFYYTSTYHVLVLMLHMIKPTN